VTVPAAPVSGGGGSSSGGGSVSGGSYFVNSISGAQMSSNSTTTASSTTYLMNTPFSIGQVLGDATSTKKVPSKNLLVKKTQSTKVTKVTKASSTLKASKNKVAITLTKDTPQASIDGTILTNERAIATESAGFWSRLSSVVASIKETLRLHLSDISWK
jgi:hypothetical protein